MMMLRNVSYMHMKSITTNEWKKGWARDQCSYSTETTCILLEYNFYVVVQGKALLILFLLHSI